MAEPTLPDSGHVMRTNRESTPWQHWLMATVVFAALVLLFFVAYEFLSAYDPRVGAALQGGAVAAMATV